MRLKSRCKSRKSLIASYSIECRQISLEILSHSVWNREDLTVQVDTATRNAYAFADAKTFFIVCQILKLPIINLCSINATQFKVLNLKSLCT